ncbi:dopamine receptor 1-like [Mytilus edulis]|uniref:Dopamine D1-like receptor n=2 Tax=Mytilus TaxID=6548 RepID=A0A8B6FR49_MYTGA|nr:DRD1 [Mytilus edulis]VDI52979.1 dopamine D1-like receptor [Mytilus galloprovincialis]
MITNFSILDLSSDSPNYTIFDTINSTNVSNNTNEEATGSGYQLAEKIIIGTILSLFIILAIVGNILVCVAVFTDRRLKHLNNLLLVSLAIADLLVAILVMTFAVINDILDKWIFGATFCDIWISGDIMCSTASILNLCVISLDRYIHIRDPFRYENWMNWKKIAAMISAVWIMSCAISFIPIHLEWHKNAEDRGKPLEENVCAMELNPVYSVVSSTISFYIPCIVMLAIYIQLYCYARRHVKSIKKTQTPQFGGGKNSSSQDHKAAVTLGIIVGVFLFCWLPFFIINLIAAFCKCVPLILFKILTWLGYVNSCLNPIIYSIFNQEFRDAFRRILFPKSCVSIEHRNGYAYRSPNNSYSKPEYTMRTVENGAQTKELLEKDKVTAL